MRILELVLGLAAVVVIVIGTHYLWPMHEVQIEPVPYIVTVHDTIHDTLRIKGPKVVTTDTVQLVIQQTIHDTIVMPTGSWLIAWAEIGAKRGDTSVVGTTDGRRAAVSRIWTPGPLKSIWADTSATPRMDFYAPQAAPKTSLWAKLKWSAVGYGVCTIANGVKSAVH